MNYNKKKIKLVYNLTLLNNVSLPLILCCCKKAYFKHILIILFLFQLLLPLHWHFSCCLCVSTLLILARMEISKFTFQNTLLFCFIITNIYFRISFGICGRFTTAELLSFSMALFIVCIWVLTGHWLLMDGKC